MNNYKQMNKASQTIYLKYLKHNNPYQHKYPNIATQQ